jgi:hypothetical protein
MHVLTWAIQGLEKPKPLDVIHMEVGEQEVDARNLRAEGHPQPSDAGTGVEHHQCPVNSSHLDT